MQSRSLKSLIHKYFKPSCDYIWDILNTEIFSFKDLFLSSKELLFGLKKQIILKEIKYNHAHVKNDVLKNQTSLKVFRLTKKPVLIRNKNLSFAPLIEKNQKLKISLSPPHKVPDLKEQVKWYFKKVDISTIARDYPVDLKSKLVLNNNKKIRISLPPVKVVAPEDIHLQRKLMLTEEIIELIPYTKDFSSKKLKKIPMTKYPLPKSAFSTEQSNYIKEKLANQAKTRKTNIEIVSVFDKFNMQLYSKINQSRDGKSLECYLSDKKISIKKEKLYYLVIGLKKDTKTPLKTLMQL